MLESLDFRQILQKKNKPLHDSQIINLQDENFTIFKVLTKINHKNLIRIVDYFVYDTGLNKNKLYVVLNVRML